MEAAKEARWIAKGCSPAPPGLGWMEEAEALLDELRTAASESSPIFLCLGHLGLVSLAGPTAASGRGFVES